MMANGVTFGEEPLILSPDLPRWRTRALWAKGKSSGGGKAGSISKVFDLNVGTRIIL